MEPIRKEATGLDSERVRHRQAIATRFCGVAALSAVIVGTTVLFGWATGLETVKRILPGQVAMNPMTAVLFVLAGLSLWWQRPGANPGKRPVARLLAAIVILVAALKLAMLLAGRNASLDSLLFADKLADSITLLPNRMAPNTAANFLATGLALWMLDRTSARGWRPAEPFAAMVAIVSLLALLGYLYRVGPMYGVYHYIPMAVHTAASFMLLAAGLFCARPAQGWMGVATGLGPGGAMARLMLPGMLALLVVIGWLRVEAERRGLVEFQLAAALYTSTFILMSAVLIVVGAISMDRAGAAHRRAVKQREQAFAELQRSEARIHSIIETARDAFVSIDARGLVTEWNTAAEDLFGWSRGESLGRDPIDLIVPEQDRHARRDALQRRAWAREASAPNRRIEITALRRDGTEFPIELSIWPQASDDSPGFNAFIRDITESRHAEAEIRGLNADLVAKAIQLEQSNRELESFSYSISHDLRAPLRHINGYALILLEDAAPQLDAGARRYLDEIGAAARRMGALIDDLLAFSRLGRKPVDRVAVDMRQLLVEALQELVGAPDPRITVGPLPAVEGDPALLRQVWVNLLSNALKYSAPRGDAARIAVSGEREGDLMRYRVADNGVGFDMRYADKLFGVFRRLHSQEEFEGTGVGLAIVQRIVSRHGGSVSAIAEPDRGATFTFELPAEPVVDTLQVAEDVA
jgi:PAS domain S-box-containing protein